MRYYPTGDIWFYVDVNDGWDRYCRYPATKSWGYKDLSPCQYINYWRDLEARLKELKKEPDPNPLAGNKGKKKKSKKEKKEEAAPPPPKKTDKKKVEEKKPKEPKGPLYFKHWPKTRLRPMACLPMLYAKGNRFIQLEKAPPAGFRCATLPMNLEETRNRKAEIKAYKKEMKRLKKEAKKQKALEKQRLKNKRKRL